jgi:hypothetical protein
MCALCNFPLYYKTDGWHLGAPCFSTGMSRTVPHSPTQCPSVVGSTRRENILEAAHDFNAVRLQPLPSLHSTSLTSRIIPSRCTAGTVCTQKNFSNPCYQVVFCTELISTRAARAFQLGFAPGSYPPGQYK